MGVEEAAYLRCKLKGLRVDTACHPPPMISRGLCPLRRLSSRYKGGQRRSLVHEFADLPSAAEPNDLYLIPAAQSAAGSARNNAACPNRCPSTSKQIPQPRRLDLEGLTVSIDPLQPLIATGITLRPHRFHQALALVPVLGEALNLEGMPMNSARG